MKLITITIIMMLATGCCKVCKPEQLPPIIIKPPAPPVRTRPELRASKVDPKATDAERVKSIIQDLEDVIGYSETLEEDLKAYR